MASFLCDLVKPYVEKLMNGAISEARHVFCFTCIVKQFEEERASLEPERKTIEQRVKVAKERDKDIQANVVSWVEDVDKLNQVDTKTKQTCFFGFCPDCIWRYKKGKELANNLEYIKRLLEDGKKLESIELTRPLLGVECYSSQYYIPFKSREIKHKELLDALKDDNNYITGLQGMGGTGKTTLAKEVGKELKQSEQFAYVVDTTVSFTPDVKIIQDDIAGSLGLKWEDCNEPDRPKKLFSRLTNGDKILVILDDVWDQGPPLDFDAIGIPKRDTHKGCRILVTSRNQETFNNMDCDKTIELGLLSEEEAWIMFKRYAKISDSTSQKLFDKGRKIAKECKQLPVAISAIASSLKGHEHREGKWDVTLKSLKKPGFMGGVDNSKVGIYNCLKISYDNLMNEKVKRLFLLCSIFREDEVYSGEVLTRLCIGVDLFGEDYGSYDDARNQVELAKDRLVDSCLLLEVNAKRLKMHDLVRDVAHWIANKEIQCVKLFDKNQKSLVENQTNIKYLLCEGKCVDLFSLNFDGSKLEILIVKVDRDDDRECIEVPNSFFENVIKLRVLYFAGKDHRPLSLPGSIQLLTNIRSMSFDNVDLGDISILGKLQRLETLELVRCKIKELPDQITKLRKFKLLKLEDCEIRMKNPFEVIKRCSSLEELYFIDSFNDFCQEIILPELQRYQIEKGGWKRYELSNYVEFRGDGKCQFSEETLKYCMQTAESLYLEGIKWEWRNLMPKIVPVELGMNDLVELNLSGILQLQCLIDTTGSHVPILSNLVVLELENMENLEELFNGPLSFESLNNLEHLSIKDCKHLRSLFKCKVNLCNLKRIRLENCPMLVSILQFLSAKDLPVLEAIRIRKCDGLQYVFGQSQHVELVSLTELEIFELPKFIGIFEECYDPMSSCVKGSSSTSKAQIQLDPMRDRDQPHDCSVASESNSYGLNILECLRISSKILGNIKEIVLTHFPKMKSVFILSIDLIMQLETLEIRNCDELKHVIIDTGDHNTGGNICVNVFPKLKELYVKDCAQLEYIFGPETETNDHQNHMEVQLHLPELTDLKLVGLPSLIATCPKQYQITFPSLKSLGLRKCSGDNKIIKELSGNVDHFLTLERLYVYNNSNAENILSLNEQQLDLGLKVIDLSDLPMMTRLFVGPKYSFSLKNLIRIKFMGCDKLKIAFSTSILRFLPELRVLTIKECKELEHIIEDDLEIKNHSNSLSSTTCFPKLERLAVIKCNNLKSVFPFSVCKELPKLRVLLITEANDLEEIFKSEDEDDQKVDIPNLNIVALDMLPSLHYAQGNQFQAVKNRFVQNCQKLTLTSASTTNTSEEILDLLLSIDYDLYKNVKNLFEQLRSAETTEDFEKPSVENVLTNSKELLTEHSLGETDTVVKPSQGIETEGTSKTNNDQVSLNDDAFMKVNSNAEEQFSKGDEIIVSKSEPSKGDPSQKVEDLAILPTNSEIQTKQTPEEKHEFVENVPDVAILPTNSEIQMKQTTETVREFVDNAPDLAILPSKAGIQMKQTLEAEHEFVENFPNLAILPTNSEELLHEQSLGETETIVKPSQLEGSTSEKTAVATVSTTSGTKKEPPIQGTTKTNNDQLSPNGDAFIKVNSSVEEQLVSKSKPSPSITSPIASQFPSMPYKGDPSEKVEDLSSSFLVKRELEQLVSKNHLDYENLSLLTDFLIKNPSVRLKDTSLNNRYKGLAYNLLAELLKFLETHSLLEVSGSWHTEFMELLQVARNFTFDKEWLDGVERRALFPEIQVSPDALEKLLDSKKRVTKDVEDLRLKIDILSQVAEDLKHQLKSSEAVLESIIQQEAVLSAPIGY